MSSDMLEHFSLLEYAIMAAIYSLLVFTGTGFKSAMVFSKRNTVPTTTIFSEHLKFLTILLVLTLTVAQLYPKLPQWSKEIWLNIHGRSSALDLGFVLAMAVMYLFERRRIYVEADPESEATQ
jgi:hypothetical protein